MEIEEKEQLIRIVTGVGNGAHIFAPKEWINEKVLIVRLEKKSIKDQILEKLYPYLDKIIAVFLYGSHVRGEATESSDLDVLVIAREKFKLERDVNEEFIVLSEEEIQEAIKINPILMYSVFREASAIINQGYLEKLKKLEVNFSYFKKFIAQTEDSIKSSREIIELDKKTGKYASDSVIYSVILRLRGVFIIHCLLKNAQYSNSAFEKWLKPLGIDYSEAYKIYREIRGGSFGKETHIPIQQEEKLINFLQQEVIKLKKRIK